MDAGLSFRDSAIVGLDLRGLALDEDALDGFAACRDENALGDRSFGGTEGDRDFCCGVAGVREIDGDQPGTRLSGSGKDAVDGDVGEALVRIDPIRKKPGKIPVRADVFEKRLEGA